MGKDTLRGDLSMGRPEAGLGQDAQCKERLWELTLRPGGAGADAGCHAVGKVTATKKGHSAPWRKWGDGEEHPKVIPPQGSRKLELLSSSSELILAGRLPRASAPSCLTLDPACAKRIPSWGLKDAGPVGTQEMAGCWQGLMDGLWGLEKGVWSKAQERGLLPSSSPASPDGPHVYGLILT